MASGLLNVSDVSLHLNEEIESISNLNDHYELNSTKGNNYKCEVAASLCQHQARVEPSLEPLVLFVYPPEKQLPLKYKELLSFCWLISHFRSTAAMEVCSKARLMN